MRDMSARAEELYRSAIVIDMHNDLPSRMLDGYDPDVRHQPGFEHDDGETDLPRLVESGITAQFLAAFVHARFALARPDESWARVQQALEAIHGFVRRHPDRLGIATTGAEIRRAKADGRIAILIGVEGGHAIEASLDHLRELHRRGVRYLTLTWNNGNEWAGSSLGEWHTPTGGLSAFGRDVVREMNRLGMLVDVSHVSDATFADVVETSSAPVIASHSSARALVPHPRNLSDDQLRTLAATGGVANVNFYAGFVDAGSLANQQAVGDDANAVRRLPRPPVSVIADHIDHMVAVAGIHHVGIGSDFDGVGGFLPEGMRDVTDVPRLVDLLLARGYPDDGIGAILGGNMLRVIERVCDRGAGVT